MWHWEGRGEEAPLPSLTRFKAKSSRGAGAQLVQARSLLRGAHTDGGRRGNDGTPLSLARQSRVGQRATRGRASQHGPGPDLNWFLHLHRKANQVQSIHLWGGGAGGRSMCHRTLDVNRYTNVLRPIPFPTHCWPVLKHVPPRVKRQQGKTW